MMELPQDPNELFAHVLRENGIDPIRMDALIRELSIKRQLTFPAAVHLIGIMLAVGTVDGAEPN